MRNMTEIARPVRQSGQDPRLVPATRSSLSGTVHADELTFGPQNGGASTTPPAE